MSWLDTVFKFISYARYNTVTPSLTNGQTSELQCGPDGRLLVNTLSVTTLWDDAGAPAAEAIIKNAPGKVYQVIGRNTGGATRYFFLFNSATRPSNGSSGEMFIPIRVLAGESFSLSIDRARDFATGLYWGVSTTDGTFTFDAAGVFAVAVEYE